MDTFFGKRKLLTFLKFLFLFLLSVFLLILFILIIIFKKFILTNFRMIPESKAKRTLTQRSDN